MGSELATRIQPRSTPAAGVIMRVLLLAGMFCSCGCTSRDRADVRGSVTLNGEPLAGGVIVFEPADGKGATAGGEIQAGEYELVGEAGVPPGPKIVRITGVMKTGRQIEVGPPAPPGTLADEVVHIPIPATYNHSSTLRREVVVGQSNRHDFELRSQ